jgi:hypothetical protein
VSDYKNKVGEAMTHTQLIIGLWLLALNLILIEAILVWQSYILIKILRARTATRIALTFYKKKGWFPNMSVTQESLQVGGTYLVTAQPVGDAGEAEGVSSSLSWVLDDPTFGNLVVAVDSNSATLGPILKSGTAKLVVSATNTIGNQISGEADMSAAGVATSINLTFAKQ